MKHLTDLRKAARGQQCMVRLDGVCNHDSATVVLGHVRMQGVSGMGMKAPDPLGTWICHACHSAADSLQWNGQKFEREYVELAFLRGVIRTQDALIREEILRW
jgi:hypothetical protein